MSEETTQQQRRADAVAALQTAMSTTLNLPGRLTSEYRALCIAQWIIVALNALVWAVFACSAHLPAWAPTVVSSVSGLVVAIIQTNYANNRTGLKQTATEVAG